MQLSSTTTTGSVVSRGVSTTSLSLCHHCAVKGAIQKMYFPHLWSSVSSVAQWMNNFLQVQLQLQHHMMFIDCWIPIFNFERTNTFSVLTTATTLFVSHLRPPSSQWAWAQLNTEHMHHQLRKWHCPLPAVAVIDDDDGQYVCILFNECFVFCFFFYSIMTASSR